MRRIALLGAILVASLASPVVGQGRDESGCLKLDGSNFNDEVQKAISADSESLVFLHYRSIGSPSLKCLFDGCSSF